MNMFAEAARRKLRFNNPNGGTLTVEDLWDLPLKSGGVLDLVAQNLQRELKSVETESFITPKTEPDQDTVLGFEIVKFVIEAKTAEIEASKLAAAKKAQKQKLLDVLARKEDEKIESMSAEEIKQMLDEL